MLVADSLLVLTALAWNIITDPGGKNAVDPLAATALIESRGSRGARRALSMAEFQDGHIVNAVNILAERSRQQRQTAGEAPQPADSDRVSLGFTPGAACNLLRKHASKTSRICVAADGMESANLPVKRK